MNTARKLLRFAAVATAAALVLAGCGGSPPAPAAAAPGSVDLRMTVWTSNEAQLGLFNDIAKAYSAGHPEIGKITFESLPFAAYNTTLTTQVAGGNSPDLAWMGDLSRDLIAGNALVPLTDTLKATPGWGYDDLLGSLTAEYSKDGQLFAYPFSNSPYALYINKDLLAKAGKTVDPAKLTWAELSSIGAAVTAATGKGGFVVRDFDYAAWFTLATVWTGWGASAWSTDGKTCEFTSQPMTEAFQFLHNAIYVDKSMPGPGVKTDFFAGDAAFTIAQVSRASLLTGSFAYDIQPLPAGPTGPYSVLGQAGVGVLKSSKHVPQATDFLAFLTNPENAAKLAQFFPPPRASLLTGAKLAANNTKLSPEQLQKVVVDQLPRAVALPNHKNPAEITQKAKTAMDALWNPDANVPAVLATVCAAINPLLAK